eukprot:gnl/TRDRNA2_/TRDRNA2_127468_c0_seq2.p1 gnl/TRDRNA2_/TRDRNA2_127468_c0~~gnl/TRDRNA2_/TRDRNA2_127468_c0_seq2.p1  ORF type:complete len:310 (+),score=82.57 gnl/TRDRNA2_/TRDRNA2_127468_c0_seq2:35-964(+)
MELAAGARQDEEEEEENSDGEVVTKKKTLHVPRKKKKSDEDGEEKEENEKEWECDVPRPMGQHDGRSKNMMAGLLGQLKRARTKLDEEKDRKASQLRVAATARADEKVREREEKIAAQKAIDSALEGQSASESQPDDAMAPTASSSAHAVSASAPSRAASASDAAHASGSGPVEVETMFVALKRSCISLPKQDANAVSMLNEAAQKCCRQIGHVLPIIYNEVSVSDGKFAYEVVACGHSFPGPPAHTKKEAKRLAACATIEALREDAGNLMDSDVQAPAKKKRRGGSKGAGADCDRWTHDLFREGQAPA